MVIESVTDDIILSSAVSGLPANWLRGSLERLGFTDSKNPPAEGFSAESNFKAWRDIWGAGHGVWSIRKIAAVAEIVGKLEAEYRQFSHPRRGE